MSSRKLLPTDWQGLLMALASGALYPLAFAPFHWWPLSALSMALFFLLIHRASHTKQALWRAWVFGLGLFGAGVHWVYFSLFLFGEAIAPLAFLITFLFVALLALCLVLLAWLLSRFASTQPVWAWCFLLAPALWTLQEWFRSWFLTGFPWLSAGYSQTETVLAASAPVIGVFGVSYLLALLAGGVVYGFLVRTPRSVGLLAALAAGIFGVCFALSAQQWTNAEGRPLQVALIQPNIAQDQKFREETILASIRHHRRQTRYLAGKADVVLWPETAIPTFYDLLSDEMDAFGNEMREQGTAVLSGVFTYQKRGEEDLYFNSVRELGGEGQTYSKRHLVPFSERIPMKGLLQFFTRFIMIPMSDLQPGEGVPEPFQLAGQSFAISICYEDAFGNEVIRQLPDATVLLNVSNDAWFGASIAPEQHLQIAQMRVLETGRPMIRGTNTGVSAFIAADGRIIDRTEIFEEVVLLGEVQPTTGTTPFMLWGNWPIVIFISSLIAVCVLRGRYTQRKAASI